MSALQFWSRLSERMGTIGVVMVIASFPIISYFSYIATLGLPIESASAENFSRFSFFLLGSVAVSIASGRVFDFLLTAIFSLFFEAFAIARGSFRARRYSGSERKISTYELYVIKSLDKFLARGLSYQAHLRSSIFFAVLFYWVIFLDGNQSIWLLFLLVLLFVMLTNGIDRRKRIPAYIRAKRQFLKRVAVAAQNTKEIKNRWDSVLKDAEARRLRGEVDLEQDAAIAELKSLIEESEVQSAEISDDLKKLRYIAVSPKEIPSLIYWRIQPNLLNAIENPVGLIAILSAIGIFIGSARAELLLNSPESLIIYGEQEDCGRILAMTDQGLFYRSSASGRLTLISREDSLIARFRDPACK